MSIESWMNPDEVADLAAHARAMIDAALVGTDLSRDAYWSAVRKGYNTPYNDPQQRRALPGGAPQPAPMPVQEVVIAESAPAVVAPAVMAAEIRAI